MGIKPGYRDVDVAYYYPNTVSPSNEFKAIAGAENPELNKLWLDIWKWMLNTFVYDLDKEGATRWESMLNIYPPVNATLESRKKAILNKINATLPYTERKLQAMLDGVYGKGNVGVNVRYSEYELWLNLVTGIIPRQEEIKRYARLIIPANLGIFISNRILVNVSNAYAGGLLSVGKRTRLLPDDIFAGEDIEALPILSGTAGIRRKVVI